jgi:hypothetical protein
MCDSSHLLALATLGIFGFLASCSEADLSSVFSSHLLHFDSALSVADSAAERAGNEAPWVIPIPDFPSPNTQKVSFSLE